MGKNYLSVYAYISLLVCNGDVSLLIFSEDRLFNMKSSRRPSKCLASSINLHFTCIFSSGEGWEHVENVGITKDLAKVLDSDEQEQYNTAYVRALSFTYPQKSTMEDFAEGWRMKVQEAHQRMKMMSNDDDLVGGGTIATIQRETQQQQMNVITVGDEYEFDDDDEDMDEDELDDYLQMMAESRAAVSSSSSPLFVDATSSSSVGSTTATAASDNDDSNIISPFESETSSSTPASKNNIEQEGPLELNKENVDKVLDEVRPYLISDGGNVSVQNVDTTTGNVYLVLEGACGSCASSTVTMQMGIERVLKEKFEEKLGEVIQVDPNDGDGGDGGNPTELTMEAVQSEVKRISQAITAMGGVVRVVSVDKIGVVEIEFRGPNKVKKGLELALLDVEYVKHVKFVS